MPLGTEVKDFLSRKYGPLPLWGWLVAGGGALALGLFLSKNLGDLGLGTASSDAGSTPGGGIDTGSGVNLPVDNSQPSIPGGSAAAFPEPDFSNLGISTMPLFGNQDGTSAGDMPADTIASMSNGFNEPAIFNAALPGTDLPYGGFPEPGPEAQFSYYYSQAQDTPPPLDDSPGIFNAALPGTDLPASPFQPTYTYSYVPPAQMNEAPSDGGPPPGADLPAAPYQPYYPPTPAPYYPPAPPPPPPPPPAPEPDNPPLRPGHPQ